MDSKNPLGVQIENELKDYFTRVVRIGEDWYSQERLVRRIGMFENKVYPTGKFDTEGNYKFWFDIISPRVSAEVKNIDFDTKDVFVYSNREIDTLPNLVTNLKVGEYMKKTGQAEEINSSIEEGSARGNVVWKKVRGTYERVDGRNFFVINQTAENLDESPVIERHELSAKQLRAKKEKWQYIKEALEDCKTNSYSNSSEDQDNESTTPFYEIYERNGEVALKDLKEWKTENGVKTDAVAEGDEDIYILAKVIGAGLKPDSSGTAEIKHVLFAEEMSKMPYEEYHRSAYKGKWYREGLYELLFDLQIRANQIGNQIAQGLEWSSKTIFVSPDNVGADNVIADLMNGDIVKASTLSQVPVRMQGIDQLIADWNRVINQANEIANSQEIVLGITPASGTPLGTSRLLNQNAGKLFDFIREKIAIPFGAIFENWIVPSLIKDIKMQDVLRLTGDSDMMNRFYELVVDSWYVNNLAEIGAHSEEVAETIKADKMEELVARPEIMIEGLKEVFQDYKPFVSVVITGENTRLPQEIEDLATFIGLETDPIRRSAMIELAMKKKSIDVAGLPKSDPEQIQNPTQPSPSSPPDIEVGAET
jgi:hypothetical protein|tara:strand:- start:25772 stop:27547 length:1776 start_codon:yes stop_codon:yes gene_type:complete